ncbi:MAG: PAS domain-containing protein [Proteobacteria bacterium]|nr:PAS domain-containing protein [Pseudomonadota bacterium]
MEPGARNPTAPSEASGFVQRFILQENVKRFRDRLSNAASQDIRDVIARMLQLAEGELALLEAMERGVLPRWQLGREDDLAAERAALRNWFHATFDETDVRATLIDPAPGLKIVDVAGDLDLAPGRSRLELVGHDLFDMFPDNPDGPAMRNVQVLYTALRAAADTGQEQTIAPYRHDLLDGQGRFVERRWRGACRPLTNKDGRLVLLLGLMENITQQARGSGPATP